MLLFIDGLGSGGAQRQFAHLAIGLAARGHRVTVAVYNDQDHFARQISAAGIDIVRLIKRSRFSPRPIFGLAKLYRTLSAQVVIAFLRSPAMKAELARLLAPRMTVIAAERSAFPELPVPLRLRLSQQMHRLARFITVNSANQANLMRREFPALADRIVTIHNGIPPMPVAATRGARGPLRLVAVSSVMPYKNSVRLAEAIALLRDERGIRVSLTWLGETFEHLDRYGAYPQTCARIAQLGLADQWTWRGVTRDVATALAEHDALIHPSLFEGTSNAVCEAMGAALPVLAGRIADHRRMLEDTRAGILFDSTDVRSIADAIASFAELGEDARKDMGARGRAVITEHYSFTQMIASYERLALAAARNHPAPAELAGADDNKFGPCAA